MDRSKLRTPTTWGLAMKTHIDHFGGIQANEVETVLMAVSLTTLDVNGIDGIKMDEAYAMAYYIDTYQN